MKRWVHAKTSFPQGNWVKSRDDELQKVYYTLKTPEGSASLSAFDDDGDWGYELRIDTSNDETIRRTFRPHGNSIGSNLKEEAMIWAEDYINACAEDALYASTKIMCGDLVDNDKIQVGLQYNNDGHIFEVQSISKDGKKCKVTEEWISEDTGKHMKKTYTYVIETDDKGQEYMYDPKYADYKDEWWGKKYAQGADNYPFDWDMRMGKLDKHYKEAKKHKDDQLTLEEAIDTMQASADAGDEYRSVKVIVDDNQTIYNGYSLEEARKKLHKYLDYDAKYHWVDFDITIWLYSEESEYEEDDYTPSATRGDYSPSNPWDAPGMSIHDFI